jgi:serine/threonine protein kinase
VENCSCSAKVQGAARFQLLPVPINWSEQISNDVSYGPSSDRTISSSNAEPAYGMGLVRIIGQGHRAIISEVKNSVTRQMFAIKSVRILPFTRKRARTTVEEDFKHEVKSLQRLGSHCHIVKLIGTDIYKQTFRMILSPVAEEGSLDDFLDEYQNLRHTLSDGRLHSMTGTLNKTFECLASAISFLHSKCFFRWDIKPSNTLVHQDSVILADFG